MSLQQAEREAFDPSKAFYLTRPKGYTILNSTPERRTLTYGGNSITVPSREEIVKPHPKFPDDPSCPYSAIDEETGEFIPGTIVMRDLGSRREGNFTKDTDLTRTVNHTAELFLKNVFQVDPHGKVSGVPFQQGLSVLPQNPTKEQLVVADAAGRERYRDWKLKNAAQIIRDHENRNASAARSKLPTILPDKDVRQAQRLIEESDDKEVRALYKKLQIDDREVDRGLEDTRAQVAVPEPTLSNEEIVDQVLANPAITAKIKAALGEDYTIRKRRVPKSKQTDRAKKQASKTGKRARSNKIVTPED